MKRILAILSVFLITSCSSQNQKGSFTVEGKVSNAPDQKVFLEQIFFNQNQPHIVDTTEMKEGKFELKAKATEEGLYRIRFEKTAGYLVVNDKDDIRFSANANDSTLKSVQFNSPGNSSLNSLIITLDSIHSQLIHEDQARKQYQQQKQDTLAFIADNAFNLSNEWYNRFLVKYIDTVANPINALFALSYTQDVEMDTLKNVVARLTKKYPGNSSVAEVVKQFNQFAAVQDSQSGNKGITVGETAPDITLPDVDGKEFSLSSLRGKYVLIDFWASWCGPCRQENPNVVANYKEFKDRNFTVLGVSLDKDKNAWLKAIKDDGLVWKQISDLKFWNSQAATLYNVEAIPYNVLIDPQGKIIGTELRGSALHAKLAEVLPAK